MFFKFYTGRYLFKKVNSYYLNFTLLFRSLSQELEPEQVLKVAWSRKIKKGPAPAMLTLTVTGTGTNFLAEFCVLRGLIVLHSRVS